MQQLHQPLRRSGRTQQVAIDLAQHRKGTGQNDHVDHGLAQITRRYRARSHGLRAPVQAPQKRSRGRDDDEGD